MRTPEPQNPPLRTAFQFVGIDRRKEQLWARLGSDRRLQQGYRLAVATRVGGAYLDWLGQPLATRKVHKVLEKRDKVVDAFQDDLPAGRVAAAVEMVQIAADNRSGLGVPLLRRLNARLDFASAQLESSYREAVLAAEFPGHQPFEPQLIEGAIERSMDWFDSEGTAQLHPLERSVLSLARLVDIAPFARVNLPTLVLASSYYLVAAGFPFPGLTGAERPALARALQAASQMYTQPLIDLYVHLQEQMLDELQASGVVP